MARVPTLIYGGGADGFTKNIPNELAPCRTRGMPIAVALQPGRGHSISGSKPTRYAYLDAVLAQRLPARPGGALRPIDLRAGFLGDNRSHTYARYDAYRGDKRSASWLPSARAAAEWRRWTTTG